MVIFRSIHLSVRQLLFSLGSCMGTPEPWVIITLFCIYVLFEIECVLETHQSLGGRWDWKVFFSSVLFSEATVISYCKLVAYKERAFSQSSGV